jgi:hypothetical protein
VKDNAAKKRPIQCLWEVSLLEESSTSRTLQKTHPMSVRHVFNLNLNCQM